MSNTVRVRFAPSPTGHLHVGGARTALFNYLFAKSQKEKGIDAQFLLRVEDTDKERSSEVFLKSQLQDLKNLGIISNEGVFFNDNKLSEKGDLGPYRQSDRLDIYQEYVNILLAKGLAYYCFLTDEEIDIQKDLAKKNKSTQQIISPYRPKNLEDAKIKIAQSQEKIQQGQKPSVRFNTSSVKPEYIIEDLVRGKVTLPSEMVGDFVIQRSNGMPVYNFCCVVDDALMKITHVLRAEEHLSNTLRQLMIYEALKFTIPRFAHMSLILGEDKKKLSKRHGATSVEDYLKEGYLPEALVNFLCLLGWSHPEAKEIFTLKDAAKVFDLKRLNSAPAVFDTKKLLWMNGEYMKAMSLDNLRERLLDYALFTNLLKDNSVQEYFTDSLGEKITGFCSSAKTLKEAMELLKLIFFPLEILKESQEVLNFPETKTVLKAWVAQLKQQLQDSNLPTEETEEQKHFCLTTEEFISIQNQIKETCQVKGKHLFMPIRVAVIGKPHGAELKELVPLISVKNLIQRAEKVIKKVLENKTNKETSS
ncbi:MAG: glutamate--tRNA ligase [Bdellovibrionaceae bacterium]|nr:glutamate--tRNA ligase [Pseudobdellovibrionaceae bacterium]